MVINNIDEAERIIEESLEEVRPHLRVDGGDIELVSVSPDGIIEVRFLGECATCSLAIMTLRAGVERVLIHALPSIRRIEMV
jgi:Fe-S cluster biogenesis protein NfuA